MACCEAGSIPVASWLLKRHHELRAAAGSVAPAVGAAPSSASISAVAATAVAAAAAAAAEGLDLAADHATHLNNFGSSPLLSACLRGHLGAARWLVARTAAGGLLHRPNHAGWSPVLAACQRGHLPVVRWLAGSEGPRDGSGGGSGGTSGGASRRLFKRNHGGTGPVLVAAAQGHAQVLCFLAAAALARARAAHVEVPAMAVPREGAAASVAVGECAARREVRRLLRAVNGVGEAPLGAACKAGHVDAALALLRFGALATAATTAAAAAAEATSGSTGGNGGGGEEEEEEGEEEEEEEEAAVAEAVRRDVLPSRCRHALVAAAASAVEAAAGLRLLRAKPRPAARGDWASGAEGGEARGAAPPPPPPLPPAAAAFALAPVARRLALLLGLPTDNHEAANLRAALKRIGN